MDALNGMFAFAIWDTPHRTLFLARDRMGVKPLYYADTHEALRLRLGDQVDLRERPGRRRGAAKRRWPNTCSSDRWPATRRCSDGVKSLPPGCTMTMRDGAARITRYWSPRPDGRSAADRRTTRRVTTLVEPARRFGAAAADQRRAGRHVLQRRRRLEPRDGAGGAS